ncbi:MAG: hypothetical protein ACJAZF_004477, partial [Granulosicoccus sp.]
RLRSKVTENHKEYKIYGGLLCSKKSLKQGNG